MSRSKASSLRVLLPAAFAALLAAGCSTEECTDNQNSLPLAVFWTSDALPKETSLDSVTVYGIGAPGDSLLADSAASLDFIYLPFRIDQPRTVYVIEYLQSRYAGVRDTIDFRYSIVPHFVSAACGAVYYYDDIEIRHTTNRIDSVICPDGRITNANISNIDIFLKNTESSEPEP